MIPLITADAWPAIVGIAAAVFGAGGLTSLAATRLQNRTTRESGFMDDQAAAITELRNQIKDMRDREEERTKRDRIRDDYIMVLRRVIDAAGLDVPAFPAALTNGAEAK